MLKESEERETSESEGLEKVVPWQVDSCEKESWSSLLVSLDSTLLLLVPQSNSSQWKVDLVSTKNLNESDASRSNDWDLSREKKRQLLASDRNSLRWIFEMMTKFSRMNESERMRTLRKMAKSEVENWKKTVVSAVEIVVDGDDDGKMKERG